MRSPEEALRIGFKLVWSLLFTRQVSPHLILLEPRNGQKCDVDISVLGFLAVNRTDKRSVTVLIDAQVLCDVPAGPNVALALSGRFPWLSDYALFHVRLDVSRLMPGKHRLTLRTVGSNQAPADLAVHFRVEAARIALPLWTRLVGVMVSRLTRPPGQGTSPGRNWGTLSLDAPGGGPAANRAAESEVMGLAASLGRRVTLLNCSGADLASQYPDVTVFAPPGRTSINALPYLDATVDIVALPESASDHARHEARRVARHLVVSVDAVSTERSDLDCDTNLDQATCESPGMAHTLPSSVSIVIPVHDQAAHTEACLDQLAMTVPYTTAAEVIVVDDASLDGTEELLRRKSALDPRIHFVRNAENVGFLQSCNRGAEMATGDILVFLNNDTLPRAGWLRALVHTFVNYPDAGAVGAKLLYPDGSLQEAGGIIYRDGSGCNYGRMDPDPDRRRYQHVRRVHYCSGAVLATPRLLFHQLGGFDPQYSPAYYEDSDYCFSVRAAGKSVYYQPNCVVVHLEGVSSGTDLRRGVKRYQVVNQQKFVEKWGKVLAGHPPRPRAHVRVAQRLKRTVVWRRARPNAR